MLGTSGCATNGQAPDNVVYLDDSGNILETIPAQYSNFWHTVAAPIQHFSVYAIAF